MVLHFRKRTDQRFYLREHDAGVVRAVARGVSLERYVPHPEHPGGQLTRGQSVALASELRAEAALLGKLADFLEGADDVSWTR